MPKQNLRCKFKNKSLLSQRSLLELMHLNNFKELKRAKRLRLGIKKHGNWKTFITGLGETRDD
jgi:hypothetical protein